MSFNKEVEKLAEGADAVTSRWKTWGMAVAFIFVVAIVIVAIVKFW